MISEIPGHEVPILPIGDGNIPLFIPEIPESAIDEVATTLSSRWIGQGPKVDLFEKEFAALIGNVNPGIAVGSGTDALHLAYLLAGIKADDEVLTPVFTCTATNIPLLYIGAKPVFVDVDPKTLNIDVSHARKMISKNTKAIICVHYGGLACDMDEIQELADEFGIPVIEDAAHAVGAKYKSRNVGSISDFTMFSFQAIKHITTGDGGFLTFKNEELLEKAKRLRWFGIDRSAKQLGVWENDILDVGYKYQMTDLGASIGLASIKQFESVLALRRSLLHRYYEKLSENPKINILGRETPDLYHAAWLFTIRVTDRRELQAKLLAHGIESNQVHYRNDRYSIFSIAKLDLPNMDEIEDEYLVLPLHTKMNLEDVDRICHVINSGW
jgi:dTDP-4-amino-4,6-dideoxygalactose transaminase